jgi:putative transposase
VSCRVLKLARAPYYRWVRNPVGPAEKLRSERIAALREAHADDVEFGYRLLADEARQLGFPMANRTTWRQCRDAGIMSAILKTRKKKGKTPGPPVCDDLVQRDFTASGPNQLWLVDITEHRTREGKIYLCAVKDVFSRRIVGYSIADRMKARLAVDAVNNAVSRRGNVTGCIVHSDRGSQFRSRKFLHALTSHGLVGSMGRVGAAGDNAAMESFFALLQNNVLNRQSWITREQLRSAIVWWIERTYHRKRRQAALGRLTPVEFETMMATPVSLAA